MSAEFSADLVELASDGDAAWFRANPARVARIRPFVPGEFPCDMPHGDGHAVTVVRQVQPGVRVRVPLYIGKMPVDDDNAAMGLLRRAMGRGA